MTTVWSSLAAKAVQVKVTQVHAAALSAGSLLRIHWNMMISLAGLRPRKPVSCN